MAVASTLSGQPRGSPVRPKDDLGSISAAIERRTRANVDAVFELACRLVVLKSSPEWMEEICTEHAREQNELHAART
jgi:hypothetical protein